MFPSLNIDMSSITSSITSSSSGSSRDYEVHSIIGVVEGWPPAETMYEVEWETNPRTRTWVKESNLTNCPAVLQDYHKKFPSVSFYIFLSTQYM